MCSVGLIPHTLPFTSANGAIKTFRHALSLDEHRAKFKANHYQWPTEEEMRGASNGHAPDEVPDAKVGTTPKAVRRVPKGTSEYQAAWIIDESDEDDEGANEDGEGGEVEMEEVEEMEELPMVEDTEMETDAGRSVAFHDLDEAEEARQ